MSNFPFPLNLSNWGILIKVLPINFYKVIPLVHTVFIFGLFFKWNWKMFLNLIKSTIKRTGLRPLSSAASVQTTSPSSKTLELPSYRENREIWVENLDSEDEKKLEILGLNKDVFGVTPRIDIIQKNIEWQKLYKYVSFAHTKTRAEVRGGGRKREWKYHFRANLRFNLAFVWDWLVELTFKSPRNISSSTLV